MLFTTPEDRAVFFLRLEQDCTRVRYGSAMDHAAKTNLGIWGNSSLLQTDCAKVMLYEVRKYLKENPRLSLPDLTIEDILRSITFCQAFEFVRVAPTNRVTHALNTYTGSDRFQVAPALDVHPDLTYAVDQQTVHVLIVNELKSKRMHLPHRHVARDW